MRSVKDNDIMEPENAVEMNTSTSALEFTPDVTRDRDSATEPSSDDLSNADQQAEQDARERNPLHSMDVEQISFDIYRFRRQCTKTVSTLLVAIVALSILVLFTGALVLAVYLEDWLLCKNVVPKTRVIQDCTDLRNLLLRTDMHVTNKDAQLICVHSLYTR